MNEFLTYHLFKRLIWIPISTSLEFHHSNHGCVTLRTDTIGNFVIYFDVCIRIKCVVAFQRKRTW